MKFIIGKKKHMTQVYRSDGRVVPATVITAGPCVVTQVRTVEVDGYEALQVGYGTRRTLSKPLGGHLKDLGNLRYLKEFRPRQGDIMPTLAVGESVDLTQFEVGEKVRVSSTSKGRGFQGVVKRHDFHGSPKTHGHKDQHRMPGSIGPKGPAKVYKGTRMGGRMGCETVTVSNLEVMAVNPKANEIILNGAVPGATNTLVLIQN